jgi:hypothetical protein
MTSASFWVATYSGYGNGRSVEFALSVYEDFLPRPKGGGVRTLAVSVAIAPPQLANGYNSVVLNASKAEAFNGTGRVERLLCK